MAGPAGPTQQKWSTMVQSTQSSVMTALLEELALTESNVKTLMVLNI